MSPGEFSLAQFLTCAWKFRVAKGCVWINMHLVYPVGSPCSKRLKIQPHRHRALKMIWVEVTVFDILYMKKGTTGFPTTLLVTSGLQGKIWVENSARTSEGTVMSRGEFGACGN